MSNMILQLYLLHFIFMLLPPAFSSRSFAKPGCPAQCGNVSIPFPFGVGPDCYLEESFNIICNTSTNPPKAYLPIRDGIEIIEINQSQSQVRVKYPYLLGSCYNMSYVQPDKMVTVWSPLTILGTQFTFSDENWLTGIGCDDVVLGLGFLSEIFGGGCVSFCENKIVPGGAGFCLNNGSSNSAGYGCCRTPFPRGTATLGAQFTDMGGRWRPERLFPCSYAFIEERGVTSQSNFSYPLNYLKLNVSGVDGGAIDWGNSGPTSTPPVVRLDWRIGADNCLQAKMNSTTFACKDNSVCTDFDFNNDAVIKGYLCRCLEGYEGNPYLAEGCQDIDECADNRTKPCDSKSNCINTPGSFVCSCPKWYQGDGLKDGRGCYPSTLINVLIGLGSGLGFLLLLSICFWLYKVLQKRKNKMRKEKYFKRNGGLLLLQQTNEGTLGKTELFPAEMMEAATDHFNESRVLGQGGQGTVYKGMLSNGKIVAIKRSKLIDKNQLEQFINEVLILSQINHRNVVKILGCCLEAEVPMLVYEFLPNGTLYDLLHDPSVEFLVSWNMRLKIATDIAGALAYLHSASSVPIYHRDIKSSNFLLDEKYIVKVADFGISRFVALDQTHLTTMVKGTFGYFDPEYFQSRQYTEKSDVYSFGVVLAELLTGKKPIFRETSDEEESGLATYFFSSMEKNSLDSILDPQVSEHGKKEDVVAVARLAQRCLNWKREMRPTMKEVATELESLRISQIPTTVTGESEDAYETNSMMTSEIETNSMMTSEIEYAWTTSAINGTSLSSDIHPFIFKTV